jgi:hypothetical protein
MIIQTKTPNKNLNINYNTYRIKLLQFSAQSRLDFAFGWLNMSQIIPCLFNTVQHPVVSIALNAPRLCDMLFQLRLNSIKTSMNEVLLPPLNHAPRH